MYSDVPKVCYINLINGKFNTDAKACTNATRYGLHKLLEICYMQYTPFPVENSITRVYSRSWISPFDSALHGTQHVFHYIQIYGNKWEWQKSKLRLMRILSHPSINVNVYFPFRRNPIQQYEIRTWTDIFGQNVSIIHLVGKHMIISISN